MNIGFKINDHSVIEIMQFIFIKKQKNYVV